MADEHTKPPFNKPSIIPEQYNWLSLQAKDGADLKKHYWEILVELGRCTSMLGIIFRKA
jgi:type I restriction enzyme M protein